MTLSGEVSQDGAVPLEYFEDDRLGARLLAQGHVTAPDIDKAMVLQHTSIDAPIGAILVRLGAVSEEDVLKTLAQQLGLDVQNPIPSNLDVDAIQSVMRQTGGNANFWRALGALPVALSDDGASCLVYATDPLNAAMLEIFERTGVTAEIRLVLPRALDRLFSEIDALDRPLSDYASTGNLTASHLKELAEQAPIIELVNAIFSNALSQAASDIHIEPFDENFRVRFRVDGLLRDWSSFPHANFDPVVSRVKLLSGMDISERRKPQDGRQSIRLSGREMDLRVSSLPGPRGESVVLRLLDKAKKLPDFTTLGMAEREENNFRKLLSEPHGIVLVTGPTGSGKSTTLYRALSTLNSGDRKIITIEDPIEYQLEGVNQTQVQADIGFTFASGLRSVLRQDPDVVMVGEIRDAETAQIAVQAALTGHLVLSTVHTNTALGGIARMTDLGVERFLLGSALRGLVGQRLLRRLCPDCAEPAVGAVAEEGEREWLNAGGPASGNGRWLEPRGCARCGNTGYRGRFAVYEIAASNAELEAAILQGASEAELAKIAARNGYRPMRMQALDAARAGQTSLAEINRVLNVRTDGPEILV